MVLNCSSAPLMKIFSSCRHAWSIKPPSFSPSLYDSPDANSRHEIKINYSLGRAPRDSSVCDETYSNQLSRLNGPEDQSAVDQLHKSAKGGRCHLNAYEQLHLRLIHKFHSHRVAFFVQKSVLKKVHFWVPDRLGLKNIRSFKRGFEQKVTIKYFSKKKLFNTLPKHFYSSWVLPATPNALQPPLLPPPLFFICWWLACNWLQHESRRFFTLTSNQANQTNNA